MSTVKKLRQLAPLAFGGRTLQMFSLPALQSAGSPKSPGLPFFPEDSCAREHAPPRDGRFVKAADVEALARWDVRARPPRSGRFRSRRPQRAPAGLHGVPGGVDLAHDARRHRPPAADPKQW